MKNPVLILSLLACHLSLFSQERHSYVYGGPNNGSLQIEINTVMSANDAMKLEICRYDPSLDISFGHNYETLRDRVLDTCYEKVGDELKNMRIMPVLDVPSGMYTFNVRYGSIDNETWTLCCSKAKNIEVVNDSPYIYINIQ
jgi:hypothetical protein